MARRRSLLLLTDLMRPIWHITPGDRVQRQQGLLCDRWARLQGHGDSRLNGTHIYGDYRSGKVHGFRIKIGEATGYSRPIDSGLNITSFGEDDQGEIYALSPNAAAFTT